MFLYSVLLRLLTSERRARDGEAMTLVFEELRHATRRNRGWLALAVLWMKETGGLARFGWRERFRRRAAAAGSHPPPDRGRWDVVSELKWAWRAVRARGWRAGLAVTLLAVALAANALMFAVADSLVFNVVPYPHAGRLIEIFTRASGTLQSSIDVPVFEAWRGQGDLFAGLHAYQDNRTAFLVGRGETERARMANVTPGLMETLGVAPRWGRQLTVDDALDTGIDRVLVSESLARRHFGSPDLAVGKRVETLSVSLLIVGVMPASFSFPTGSTEIWRALDVRGPLVRGAAFVQTIGVPAPGLSLTGLRAAMAQRSPAVAEAAGLTGSPIGEPWPYEGHFVGQTSLFYILLAAAVCLLLIACANVASLELAGALRRSRAYAVHLALGASRAMLARVALLEGVIVIGVAALMALPLIAGGIAVLATQVLGDLRLRSANPIDLDGRLTLFMVLGAAVTWLLVSLPMVLHTSRTNLLGLLKTDDRSMAASKAGARLRRGLTVVEIALAVMLVTGGLLYARTYQALLTFDKGFDSSNLVSVSFGMPAGHRPNIEGGDDLTGAIARSLLALPGVLAATISSPPPNSGNSPARTQLVIDDGPPARESISFGRKSVDEPYLRTIGLPLKGGRWLGPDDPPESIVITESFAQRCWPNLDPVGHTFRLNPTAPPNVIVGVVGDVRTQARSRPEPTDRTFYGYVLARPGPARRPAAPPTEPRPRDTGSVTMFRVVTLRLDAPDRADAILKAARMIDPKLRVTMTSVDETYASQFSETLLATRVVSAFATIAFFVAIVGVYGVMAFLVAGRTREIGIRMALGADRRAISRLVLRSSGTMVAIGAAAGIVAALVASRWTGSQFFGVAPTDPGTYILVAVVVIATSLLATWRPARAAAGVDPSITLRSE